MVDLLRMVSTRRHICSFSDSRFFVKPWALRDWADWSDCYEIPPCEIAAELSVLTVWTEVSEIMVCTDMFEI